jgi:sterol desaturase/sphingolipid hydroxylase (fatty acid hydroxylase superfamily)
MTELVLAHEPILRLAAFLATVAIMAGWEALAPRRWRMLSRMTRWPQNMGIVVLNTVLVRLVFPTAAVGAAFWAETQQMGLFHLLTLPRGAEMILSVMLLDLLIYGQHVVMHKVPALWRLHRMHHMDLDVDFTTGLRFHPVEIVLSAAIKFLAVLALGAPAAAVILFEVILNTSSLFNHGNVRLPAALDRVLRAVIVTPDMHRVHHSVIHRETESNYGFALSVWDRLFGTYRAAPAKGHAAMIPGLPRYRGPEDGGFWAMLLNPLRS